MLKELMAIHHWLFFKENRTSVLKKKNVKNISWGKYWQARAFWRNGSYAPGRHHVSIRAALTQYPNFAPRPLALSVEAPTPPFKVLIFV